MDKKIVLLTGKGISTLFMYNGIISNHQIHNVIIEQPVKKKTFLKRRIKKLGLTTVFGQVLFQLFVVKFLDITSKKRVEKIKTDNNLSDNAIPEDIVIQVSSVNSNECKTLLQKINPDIIIVSGTRIISKKILNCTKALFLNTHAGITPNYRGSHGAYWALANNDIENCGVTVHLVDSGIDTGGILHQKIIHVSDSDNFTTYPYLQIAEGIQLMEKAIVDISNNRFSIKDKPGKGKIYFHPTIWRYLKLKIFKGVK